jgi:hypothetical protein
MLSSTLASYAQKPTDTTQQVIAGRKNSPEQQKKPYLILISADGSDMTMPRNTMRQTS